MAKRGEKFPEVDRKHGPESPGPVQDDEELERRLPPGEQETENRAIPDTAFQRRELRWTEEEGGASVDRSRYAQGGVAGRRGTRSTIKTTARIIRGQTDESGDRLWSITDRPVPGNPAHAEIRREPRGKMPSKAERRQLMEAWRGATTLLRDLKEKDPAGKPEVHLVPRTGLKLQWRSGQDNSLKGVVRVESVAEAVRAYVGACIMTEAEATQEQRRLEQELEVGAEVKPNPYGRMESE